MSWQESAACREMPKSAFFVEGDRRNPRVRAAVEAAKAVCAGCPVAAECREAGAGSVGVWGGRDADERGVRLSHRPPMRCGTTQGHGLHLRRGEEPCAACCEAYEAKQVERRKALARYAATSRERRQQAKVDNVRAMFGRAS